MKKSFLLLIFEVYFTFVPAQSSNTIWTFGPMFHFYFGKHFDFTMGLEAALWKENYSIDFGLEGFNNKYIIFYSEYQKGSYYSNHSLPLFMVLPLDRALKSGMTAYLMSI